MTATVSRFGSLRWRLLAAFLTVAVGAVALLALVAGVSVDRRTAALAAAQRVQVRQQIASALAAAYTAGRGSWTPATLAGAQVIAGAHDTAVVLVDRHGRDVASYMPGHDSWQMWTDSWGTGGTGADHQSGNSGAGQWQSSGGGDHWRRATPVPSPPSSRRHDWMGGQGSGVWQGLPASTGAAAAVLVAAGPWRSVSAGKTEPVSVPIIVNGHRVGTAKLTLPATLDPSVTAARDALMRTIWIGALLAVALAAAAAVFVSRRLARPVVALTAATRSFAAGERVDDATLAHAPGELGELSASFAAMANTVRREDELRRDVVADVAHELRTPVTILRGQTELLLDGLEPPTPARLSSLHDEVLRLQRLTDDLAALSAADAAGLSLHTEPVDLGKLTRQAVDALTPSFDDAEVTVTVDAADGLLVDADATRLTQVVTNLLTNAAKFTPAAGTVTATVSREADQGVVVVRDSGPGIPDEELPHLFERFWRGGSGTGHRGTGIGLAVVQALVTAHGGSVAAVSPDSGGARFTVRLPLSRPTG